MAGPNRVCSRSEMRGDAGEDERLLPEKDLWPRGKVLTVTSSQPPTWSAPTHTGPSQRAIIQLSAGMGVAWGGVHVYL